MYFYPHHIGDFRSGTFNMTRQERWIYRDMLDVYYDNEAPFPDNLDKICAMVGARRGEDRETVAAILLLKFELTDAGYSNERCDREIASYRLKAEVAQNNGKKGGRPAKNNPEKPSGLSVGTQQEPDGNPEITGSQANQEPVTSNQEPLTMNREPGTEVQEQQQVKNLAPAVAVAAKKVKPEEAPNPLNLLTWQAYRQAYADRYSVPPIRDAATNAKIKGIVKGLGDEAPMVATFFVFHNGARYVAGMHQIGLLATDYAKLRTEWATNTVMTHAKAQQADKTATNYDAFAPLIAAARAKEEAERNQNA